MAVLSFTSNQIQSGPDVGTCLVTLLYDRIAVSLWRIFHLVDLEGFEPSSY